MKTFFVKLLASDKKFFEDFASLVVVNTFDGELGFLSGHGDTIVAIQSGELRITKANGEEISVLAGGGIMQFVNNRMLILTEFAEYPEDIDKLREREARDMEEEIIRQQRSLEEYHASRASMARAITRLKESSKYKHLGE